MARILLVTDEAIVKKSLAYSLEHGGHTVTTVPCLADAMQYCGQVDAVLAELRLNQESGLELIEPFKPSPVILMVSQAGIQQGVVAMRQGAFDCLIKPIDPQELLRTIERAAPAKTSQDPLAGTMLGHSDVMARLRKQILRVAPLDTTVLIGGESGTGKELVAQAIHNASPRGGREMISVNCAAIPETLIEAELFGHMKGAFTGATQDRAGLIEAADGATLFLDEIGELPLEAQARLLRVLQEGEIRRVGSTERTRVDIRLIAATHRDLIDMVQRGRFRDDLYYRLNVIALNCPPLREREQDVVLLADAFLDQVRTRLKRPDLRWTEDARQAIAAHQWPGNVRELQNAVERAAVLTESAYIHPEDLGLQSRAIQFSGGTQRSVTERPTMSLEDYFQHFVLSHQDQLSETELAKRLGISRKSLWERRQRLGIPKRKSDEESP
ncbi:MAG: sigma-54-dependent Fis family transcriptional regulator [Bacteroidetes bacterium]|nr:sigma-54-dependent Fis family transcriptional regulator [Bacteroidota bacterium]